MDQFALHVLQPPLGGVAFGQIAHEARKESLLPRDHLAYGELHREGRPVLAFADDDPPDADDPALARRHVAGEVAVVLGPVGVGHQHADVLPDHLCGDPSKLPLRRGREGLHDPLLVDDDHRVGDGVEDRLQVRLTRPGVARCPQTARPDETDRDRQRCENASADHDLRVVERLDPDHAQAEGEGERPGREGGAHASDGGAGDQGRHEQQEDKVVVEDRLQQDPESKADGRGRDRDGVAGEPAVGRAAKREPRSHRRSGRSEAWL